MIDKTTKKEALVRLKKIDGQVKGIERMVDEERYCIDILNQITAAQRALDQVALTVMRRHLDSCVREAMKHKGGKEKLDELMKTLQEFIK